MPEFVSKIITNPLVLIGALLTAITLDMEHYGNSLEFFKEWRTYRNIVIGAIFYVAVFDRKYTKGRKKIAILDNIVAVVGASFVIFISWLLTLGLFVQFQVRGERLSEKLRERYAGQSYNNWRVNERGIDVSRAISNVKFEEGKSYLITIYSKEVISIEEYTTEVENRELTDRNAFQTFIDMLKMRGK